MDTESPIKKIDKGSERIFIFTFLGLIVFATIVIVVYYAYQRTKEDNTDDSTQNPISYPVSYTADTTAKNDKGSIIKVLEDIDGLTDINSKLSTSSHSNYYRDTTKEFTIFLPMDGSFNKNDISISDFLKASTVEGKSYKASDLLSMDGQNIVNVSGTNLKISVENGSLFIDGKEVVQVDIAGSNGTIFIVDGIVGQ